ncbi:DUF374 domain-containing protein [bacterium]|nr:DUF374 domain-containing protein [bacterium]
MTGFLNNIKITILTSLIRILYGSCRWKITGFQHVENLLNKNGSFIIAYWHGNMFIPYLKLAKYHFHILAGFHKDAELGVNIGEKLGWKFLRGSSSQNGSEVFQQIVELLSKPNNVFAITPDGPKGPARIPKPGTVRAAQKTGIPIIPAAGRSHRSWSFTNWDTFHITKPFTHIELKFGEPLYFSINNNFDTCNNKLKIQLDSLDNEVSKSLKIA